MNDFFWLFSYSFNPTVAVSQKKQSGEPDSILLWLISLETLTDSYYGGWWMAQGSCTYLVAVKWDPCPWAVDLMGLLDLG